MKYVMPAIAAGFALALLAAPVAAQDPDNTLVMELKCGKVVIGLKPDVAPGHVERIKELTRQGLYDGVIFHRVIDGFMAQTGDPTGTGTGGSDLPDLAAEFSNVPFTRGILGMARSSDPDSANSQFFIMFDEGSFLNGQYTVVGEVVEGMDCVDQINKGEPPASPDQIIDMQVMSEAG
jgi:peptidylprolyl isomerase